MNKKIITMLCAILALLLSINALYVAHASAEREEVISQQYAAISQDIHELYEMNRSHENCMMTATLQNPVYGDDANYYAYYGRLYIPDAYIDVALYYGLSQAAADRYDSAAIHDYPPYKGEIIADHTTQEFHKLFSVKVGTTGYIVLENGDCINIECVEVHNGHNTGFTLTDESYKNVMGTHDYLAYTCRNGWMNILITQWDKY